jgi:hypothetical protein
VTEMVGSGRTIFGTSFTTFSCAFYMGLKRAGDHLSNDNVNGNGNGNGTSSGNGAINWVDQAFPSYMQFKDRSNFCLDWELMLQVQIAVAAHNCFGFSL